MCELFGVNTSGKIQLNHLLDVFFRMETNIRMDGEWHFLKMVQYRWKSRRYRPQKAPDCVNIEAGRLCQTA